MSPSDHPNATLSNVLFAVPVSSNTLLSALTVIARFLRVMGLVQGVLFLALGVVVLHPVSDTLERCAERHVRVLFDPRSRTGPTFATCARFPCLCCCDATALFFGIFGVALWETKLNGVGWLSTFSAFSGLPFKRTSAGQRVAGGTDAAHTAPTESDSSRYDGLCAAVVAILR